jgi:hypothetical protein
MKLAPYAFAATLALFAGTSAMASSVHATITGDGNIACISGKDRVYISAQVRGDYNRLCAAALHMAGSLNDLRGHFNDVDTLAVSGAIVGTVIRGNHNTVQGTARDGATATVQVYDDGVEVYYDVTGDSDLSMVFNR